MNFIQRIQAENKTLRKQLANAQQETTEFMTFLRSNKFTGEEPAHWEGNVWVEVEAKNWINTGDVLNWLKEHRMQLIPES